MNLYGIPKVRYLGRYPGMLCVVVCDGGTLYGSGSGSGSGSSCSFSKTAICGWDIPTGGQRGKDGGVLNVGRYVASLYYSYAVRSRYQSQLGAETQRCK